MRRFAFLTVALCATMLCAETLSDQAKRNLILTGLARTCTIDSHGMRSSAVVIRNDSADGGPILLTQYWSVRWCDREHHPDWIRAFVPRVFEDNRAEMVECEGTIIKTSVPDDFALIRLRSEKGYDLTNLRPIPFVSEQAFREMPMLADVSAIGGWDMPIVTIGMYSGKMMIDKKEFGICTAPSMVGCSGGAVMLLNKETQSWSLIGITSRVLVPGYAGYTTYVDKPFVSYVTCFVPVARITQWLASVGYPSTQH